MLVFVTDPDACGGSELHSSRLRVHTLRRCAQTLCMQTVGHSHRVAEKLFEGSQDDLRHGEEGYEHGHQSLVRDQISHITA